MASGGTVDAGVPVGVGVALEPGVFDTETVGVTVGDGVAVTDCVGVFVGVDSGVDVG